MVSLTNEGQFKLNAKPWLWSSLVRVGDRGKGCRFFCSCAIYVRAGCTMSLALSQCRWISPQAGSRRFFFVLAEISGADGIRSRRLLLDECLSCEELAMHAGQKGGKGIKLRA